MTDKERYVQFLQSIGMNPAVKHVGYIQENEYSVLDDRVYLGHGHGHIGFYSWFEFNEDGSFESYRSAD